VPLQQEAFIAGESAPTVPALKHPKQSLTWAQAWMITCKSRRLTVLLPSEILQNNISVKVCAVIPVTQM